MNTTKKILSIDWDYFFPDAAYYDWGHKENAFFLETIWPLRLTNRNMKTGKYALTEYTPTIPKDFWKKTVKNDPMIFVAESHASIMSLPFFKNAIVMNLDAHHDSGYGQCVDLDCGNWAFIGKMTNKIKEYHLYYPEWRKIGGECTPQLKPDSVKNGLPDVAEYDYVFVCRSGCWTPPWYDTMFNKWLKKSKMCIMRIDEYVKKNRKPNMKNAKIMKIQLDAQMEEFRRKAA